MTAAPELADVVNSLARHMPMCQVDMLQGYIAYTETDNVGADVGSAQDCKSHMNDHVGGPSHAWLEGISCCDRGMLSKKGGQATLGWKEYHVVTGGCFPRRGALT